MKALRPKSVGLSSLPNSPSEVKSKKSLYILIPLVLGLWGLIGYRIVSAMEKDEDPIGRIFVPLTAAIDEDSVAAYVPSLDYADPFLKGLSFAASPTRRQQGGTTTVLQTTAPPTVATPTQPVKVPAPWSVVYQGWVKEAASGEYIGLLVIENSPVTLKQGQTHEGFALKVLRRDSVQVMYRNEQRWVRKQ